VPTCYRISAAVQQTAKPQSIVSMAIGVFEAMRNYNYYSNEYERMNGNNNYQKSPMNRNNTPRARNQC
jgi:hypothetical protein